MMVRLLPLAAAMVSFVLFPPAASALIAQCQNNADCDDGLYCTIGEVCDPVLGCLTPAVRTCEDEFLCTVDLCDELADTCLHTPNDLLCSDGDFCDGAETCSALLGCQEAADPCDDGVDCTTDTCDETLNLCTSLPDSGQCEAGSICTLLGCTPELQCEKDADCDDGVDCTVDTCDDTLNACLNVPDQSRCNDGDACTVDLCAPLLDCQHVALPDLDFDGRCDLADNCPVEANPDQANSDCPDPTFLEAGGCLDPEFDALEDLRRGCCDGGDVCDLCPARPIGTDGVEVCNTARSGGINCPAETGCTLQSLDGCIRVSVPPGALEKDRSISVTDHIDEEQNLLLRDAFLYQLSLRPEDIAPSSAIDVSICWEDRDDDDLADEGTCAGNVSNLDLGLPCDHDDDCTAGFCSRRSTTPEHNLLLKRNSEPLSGAGAFTGTFVCGDHDAQDQACADVEADCSGNALVDQRTRAGCCDMEENRWRVSTCRFSELMFGEFAGDLTPGTGTRLTDCVTEWNVLNPHSDPLRDAEGLPTNDQSCRDGDPLCDSDGEANGQCTFSVGVCFNLTDRRMTDTNANRLCAPTSITSWRVAGAGGATDALENAVASLGSGDVVGQGGVDFSPPLDTSNACTRLVPVTVPLAGEQGTTVVLRMSGSTTYSTDSPELLATTTTLPSPDPLCGNLDGDDVVDATDALHTLRAAVHLEECDTVLCDVDADEVVSATDSLGVLHTAVDNDVELTCGLGALPSDRDRLRLTCTPALSPYEP